MISTIDYKNGLPPIDKPVLARVGDDLLAMMLTKVNGAYAWAVHAGRFGCLLDPANYQVDPEYEPQEWMAMPDLSQLSARSIGQGGVDASVT